eukprot:m.273669 g.273669  ORF g.273669 m.273669 type:complete len:771 (-) comp16282_c2_seq5:76-2388(-)
MSGITVFARLKPTPKPSRTISVVNDESASRIDVSYPKDLAHNNSNVVNNRKDAYSFRFKHVFNTDCTQDDIFDVVAKPVADSVLSGYNGTLFAYGQTGSGKTFTITGGAERYVDRGVIPRTLAYIFEQFAAQQDREFVAKISYLEIYNDVGYDLLDPEHEVTKLEDLRKVEILDTGDESFHLKNLSLNTVNSEEEALNALFIGDTNRMIAETPMNQASTRSHCIFTIHVTSKAVGQATIRRSKLHLVDLAGSERIGKTGVTGSLATESKYINLSLHYLEQVIVALSEKSRRHIPYRNSMMTSVLKDSLGGNCKTTMIATLSAQKAHIDESISTCKFAQRVALIKNDARLNEETDPALLVPKLRAEIARLKTELALATNGNEGSRQSLEPDELMVCKETVRRFVAADGDSVDGSTSRLLGDVPKMEACFAILKDMVRQGGVPSGGGSVSGALPSTERNNNSARKQEHVKEVQASNSEIAELQEIINQRDNEISILIAKLKRQRKPDRDHSASPRTERRGKESVNMIESYSSASERRGDSNNPSHSMNDTNNSASDSITPVKQETFPSREAAFEHFKQNFKGREAMVEHKQSLKELYKKARTAGEEINSSRQSITNLKSQIERYRLETGVEKIVEGQRITPNPHTSPDLKEQKLIETLDQQKTMYKSSVIALKHMKKEIEHLQHLHEVSKVRMQQEFESWCNHQIINPDLEQHTSSALPHDYNTEENGSWSHSQSQVVTEEPTEDNTTDDTADDDIEAFFRARQALRDARKT